MRKLLLHGCPTLLQRKFFNHYEILQRSGLVFSASTFSSKFSTNSINSLLLDFRNDICSIAIPLSISGTVEKRVFKVSPNTRLQNLLDMIKLEDQSVQSVEFRSKDMKLLGDEVTMDDILTDDFKLIVNGLEYDVLSPIDTGKYFRDLFEDKDLDIGPVVQKSSILGLQDHLRSLPHWKISFDYYLNICSKFGFSNKEAGDLCRTFHHLGHLLYFDDPNHPELRNVVFLKPSSVIDAFCKSIRVNSPTETLMENKINEISKSIQSMDPELNALRKLKLEIDHHAEKKANRFCYMLSIGLVGGFGLYWWLSFVHFSWDIMEPMTYFTGYAVTIFGYFWWILTNKDYEYENVYDFLVKKHKKKLYKQRHFDIERFSSLHDRFEQCYQDIDLLNEIQDEIPTVLQHDVLKDNGFFGQGN